MIYINILFYIVSILFPDFVREWFTLSASMTDLGNKPWTIFSYAFVHFDLFHILSNLLVLYYIGNLFLEFFSSKKLLIYYAIGLLVGGGFFIAFSELSNKTMHLPLGGASAAVTAIFIGVAAKIPHYAIRLRFVGSVELWVLAAIWIAISVIGASGVNAGGAIAHLGGVLTGYLLTTFFNEGSFIADKIKKTAKKNKNPFSKVYTTKAKTQPKTKTSHSRKKENQKKIDAILDKISKSGYDALSKEEKEFLFNQKDNK